MISAKGQPNLHSNNLRIKARESALETLHTIYKNASHCQDDEVSPPTGGPISSSTNTVMISGLSGTGKSTLVDQFVEDVVEASLVHGSKTKQPYFLKGKYNEQCDVPYSAIIEAFSGFARELQVVTKDEELLSELERLTAAIENELGDEAGYLGTLIPDLRGLLTSDRFVKGSEENAAKRLRYIFQTFTKAISTQERPVVLFLDDLQWIDTSSMQLIQDLLSSQELEHFMFIGCYRSDEVKKGDALSTTLSNVQMVQEYESVVLSNLSLKDVVDFLADALWPQGGKQLNSTPRSPQEERNAKVLHLAEATYKKTHGNIFFVMQILEDLKRKEVLVFSSRLNQWEIPENAAELDFDALFPEDVVDVVTTKIEAASDLMRRVLSIMAYTRSTLDIEAIHELLNLQNKQGTSVQSLVEELDNAAADGLLTNVVGSPTYSFSHDKVQEAAYKLVPEGEERENFRKTVGTNLLKLFRRIDTDWMLFTAVDHLNGVNVENRKDPELLANHNLTAGERAAKIAAFEVASKFLRLAMENLELSKDPWNDKTFGKALRVHELLAHVEFCQGHVDTGKEIANIILVRARSMDEKLPTIVSLTKALGRENRHQEGLAFGMKTLEELGICSKSTAGKGAAVARDLLFLRKYWKGITDVEFLKKGKMRDEHHKRVLELMNSVFHQAQFVGEVFSFLILLTKMCRYTIKHGLANESSYALLGYALLCFSGNDMEGTDRFKKLSRKTQGKMKGKDHVALECFIEGYFFECWDDPHSTVGELFRRGYKYGMESGQYAEAMLNEDGRTFNEFLWGFPLKTLDRNWSQIHQKIDVYNIQNVSVTSRQNALPAKVLRGSEPLDFEKLGELAAVKRDTAEKYELLCGYLARVQISVYFGNYTFSEENLNKLVLLCATDNSHNYLSPLLYFSSLTYASLGHETGKRKYFTKARKCLQELESHCKQKGMNSWHRCEIMKAHINAVRLKKPEDVEANFNEVIDKAIEKGTRNDAALASQMAGEYFVIQGGRDKDATKSQKYAQFYLRQACELYTEWGADALVQHLQGKHASLLSDTNTVESDSSQCYLQQ